MIGPDEKEVPVTHNDRKIPQINGEEDAPFPSIQSETTPIRRMDSKLGKTDDIDKEITRFRYQTGRIVLYIAMSAMGISVALDLLSSWVGIKSDLITNAFEAFKLITMTVLGYIFGSNSSK